MHCSANVGEDGRVAVFFGLSGTGKTTLSADPERKLIGDDEHGWGDNGVFNIEGGCYAKVIRLSPTAEPEIYKTTRTFGTILENVAIDEQGIARPRRRLEDREHARRVQARADRERAADEDGGPSAVGRCSSPRTRSGSCRRSRGCRASRRSTSSSPASRRSSPAPRSASPSRSRPSRRASASRSCRSRPKVYARMLGEKLDEHGSTVWLVNTGWTGGPFGEGERMPIQATRTMLRAALSGELDDVEFRTDDLFGFEVPRRCRASSQAARPALDVARPGGVRPQGTRARARCSPTTSPSGSATSASRSAAGPAASTAETSRRAAGASSSSRVLPTSALGYARSCARSDTSRSCAIVHAPVRPSAADAARAHP